MSTTNVFKLGNGEAKSRALLGNLLFAITLFLIVLYTMQIPQDIQLGRKGQVALIELDGMNHPLLNIKAAVSQFQIDGNVNNAKSELERLGEKAESCIQHYKHAADYNEPLSKNVVDFTSAYYIWLDAEKYSLDQYSASHDGSDHHYNDHVLMTRLYENNIKFLAAMALLSEGEPELHDDIAKGQEAYKILQWAVGLFFIYLFIVIFLSQRNSNREHVVREKNLEMTLRSIGDAVIATDLHGCITCMNPEAERLTGWGFKDAKGYILSEVFRVVNAHSGIPIDGLVERVQQEKGIVVLAEDSMLIAANGSRYQIYENGAPIYDDANEIIGVVLVFRDITQEYDLKNCLNENALRLQRVVDTSMDAVIVIDEQGLVKEWNPAAENIFGWSYTEIREQPLHDLIIPKEFREPHLQGIQKLIKNDETSFKAKRIESLALHRDGHTFPIDLAMTSIKTENGWVFNAFIRDLTKRNNDENLIKKNNVLLNEAERIAKVGSWEFDLVNNKLYWSDELCNIYCVDPSYQEATYDTFSRCIHPDDKERVEQAFKKSIKEHSLIEISHRIVTPDGIKFIHGKGETNYDKDGRPLRSLGVALDVTEQIKKENLIDKHNVLLRETQRIAKLGYWEMDLQTRKLEWSDEHYRILGLSADSIKPSYEAFMQAVHPDDRELVDTAYVRSVDNQTSYDLIHRIVVEGETRLVHGQCTTTFDGNGAPLRSLGILQDITELKEIEKTLIKQDKLLRETQRIAKLGYWELDLEKGVLEWSDEIFRMFGLDPATSKPSYGLFINTIHPEDRERVDAAYSESLKNRQPYNIIHRIVTSKGIRIVHEHCDTSYGDDGKPIRSLGLVQDITERVSDLDELRLAATMFRTHAGILITDKNGTIVRVNPAFEEMTGYSSKELSGKNPRILRSDKQSEEFYDVMWNKLVATGLWQGELWNKRKDGTLYAEWLTITAVKDDTGEVTNYVGTSQDITKRKHAETQIEYLAYHDDLTDLANRRLLLDRLQQNIVTCKRNNEFGAVLIVDLDCFKNLNDSLGHSVGDDVLRGVASRLQEIVREDDTVARLGSDEFIVVLSSVGKDPSKIGIDVQLIAEKIRSSLSQPYKLKDGQCFINASIGITLFPENSEDTDEILKHADTALYRAKAQGRNAVCFYQPSMQAEVDERLAIGDGLRNAIENNEFVLHYQPQVNDKGELLGAEALIRWQHPEQGMISPEKFISVAEDTGLILEIGQWVLQEATRQVAEWHSVGICKNPTLRLSVNVSPRQFGQKDFVAQTLSAFKDAGVSPDCIELEVTESMLMHDLDDVSKKMQELRSQGIRISIDDFGTGYSSLAYLKKLPLDQLKIDQSFICDITNDDNDAVVVETIIAMARHLGLSVIAEGVENQEQLDFLIEKGCDAFQGYYFYRPLNAEDFAVFIRQQSEIYLSNLA